MSVPQVAVVGRPNVGKSSLFNCLAGRRIAIVEPTAGVTRDRIGALIQADDRYFELVDTGGMGIEDIDDLTAQIEKQIAVAIDQAAVILFVVDGRAGIMPLDERVARRLRTIKKPVLCVVNKCDVPDLENQAAEFYRLGFKSLVCVSAQQKRGTEELIENIIGVLPAVKETPELDVALKVAIVGRRNTGKSTFINSLAKSERVIVSEVPGTTRDSVDIRFERDGKVFIAIDTAGVRRKKSLANDIEFYSLARAERSIRRADVVLFFFDPRWRISKVDKQLAGYILDQHKPAVFVVNKWDLAPATLMTETFGDYIRKVFPNLDYVPIAFITAKEGKNSQKVWNLAQNLFKQASARVGTSTVNRVLRKAIELQHPPLRQNRRPKIHYGTQVATQPPTLVLFTNGPELFDNTYQRYLLKSFRDNLPFHDVPIKLYLRHKHREGAPADQEEDLVLAAEASANQPVKARRAGARPRKTREPELWKDI